MDYNSKLLRIVLLNYSSISNNLHYR